MPDNALFSPTRLPEDGRHPDANDFETEHRIYHEDAVLEYSESGERTRGRRNITNALVSRTKSGLLSDKSLEVDVVGPHANVF